MTRAPEIRARLVTDPAEVVNKSPNVPLARVRAAIARAEARDRFFVTLPTAIARGLLDAAALLRPRQ